MQGILMQGILMQSILMQGHGRTTGGAARPGHPAARPLRLSFSASLA